MTTDENDNYYYSILYYLLPSTDERVNLKGPCVKWKRERERESEAE